MRRPVFDVLRRGLDNTLANWPLIAIRVAESILFVLLAAGVVFVMVVPILVSVGIELTDIDDPNDVQNALMALVQRWMLLVWIFAGILVLLLLFTALHGFVEAGCARVYVDGERIAGPALEGVRSRFNVFSTERFFAGATDGWWPVFWIYNLAWGAAGIILLIPLLPTLFAMLLLRDQPEAALPIGCLGLAVTLVLMFLTMIVAAVWTNRAIAEWALRRHGARDALAAGWRAIRADLGRHVLIALAILVVAMAGSAFFGSFSMFAALGETFGRQSVSMVFTIPLRLVGSLASSIFSAAVTSWYLASYTSLATEP